MKKQTLVAAMGTVALAANVLLPGLAFGQQTDSQVGTADIGCPGTSAVVFTQVPDDFTFFSDGASAPISVPTSLSAIFSDDDGNVLVDQSPPSGSNRFLEVSDPRDFDAGCANGGFTVTVVPQDQADADGCYFDSDVVTDDSLDCSAVTIPLDGGSGSNGGLRVVTSAGTCTGGTVINGACFRANSRCENNGSPADCSGGGNGNSSPVNTASTNFAEYATYSAVGTNTLGSAGNTTTAVTVMNFPATDGVFGEVAVGAAVAAELPAFQDSGTYQLDLLYTLTPA